MHAIIDRRLGNPGIVDQIGWIFHRTRRAITNWQERERQRRALARLDDRLLADIGITSERKFWECAKWTWPEWL